MQKILRPLTAGLDEPGEQLAFAQQIVANLPATNGFRTREGVEAIRTQYLHDDTNFWDTLLHSQDRAYTVSEVREFFASAGLHLQTFTSYQGVDAITCLQYDLDLYIQDPVQKERLKALPIAERENLAESLDGSLSLHTVYVTRSTKSSLDTSAANTILTPASHRAQQIIAFLCKSDQGISITLRNGLTIPYNPSTITKAFFAKLDGYRTNGEIAQLLGIEQNLDMMNLLSQELMIPTALHWVFARMGTGSCITPLPDRTVLSSPLRHAEPTSLPL